MKKIVSAILLVFLFASVNAYKFNGKYDFNDLRYDDLKYAVANSKDEIAATAILTAISAAAYYYEIKNNDFKVFKKFEKLIKNNPKSAAGILAAITTVLGLTIDVMLRNDDSLVSDFLFAFYSNVSTRVSARK